MVNLITDMGVDADLIWMTSPWPVFCFPFFPNEKLGVKFLIIQRFAMGTLQMLI